MAKVSDKDILKKLKSNPNLTYSEAVEAVKSEKKDADSKRYDSNRKVLNTGEFERFNPHRYQYSWTDLQKKRHSVYANDLDELRRKERQIAKDKDEGIKTNEADSITIGMMWDKFIQTKQKTLKDKTYNSYISLYNAHIKDEMGNKKIRSVCYSDIVDFYLKTVERTNCSYSTIHNVHIVLSALFKLAIKNNYISQNPCEDALKEIKGKCKDPKKKDALTVDQESKLLSFIANNETYKWWLPIITVALCTGMRMSEICGLSWDDVDFEKNEIHVRHQLQYYKNQDEDRISWHLCDTKTDKGKRIIPIITETRLALLQEKDKQKELGLKSPTITGIVDHEKKTVSNFCFISSNNTPYSYTGVNRSLKRILKEYNKQETEKAIAENRDPVLIDKNISSHNFRHTFSTVCVENDMNVKTVQSIMGHEKVETTLGIYTDAQTEKIHEDFEKIDNMFKLS